MFMELLSIDAFLHITAINNRIEVNLDQHWIVEAVNIYVCATSGILRNAGSHFWHCLSFPKLKDIMMCFPWFHKLLGNVLIKIK